MSRPVTSRLAAVTLLAAVALAACDSRSPDAVAPTLERASGAAALSEVAGIGAQLAEVRRATARFHDVSVAVAEGYVPDPACAAIPGVGAMGVHYINPALYGFTIEGGRVHGLDASIDPARPEILMYEPGEDGTLRLVGVEYGVSQAAWAAAGNTGVPSIFGVPFDAMADDPATPMDEAHGFTPHFDLHVWLWRDNPNGLFAPWNPKVACPSTSGSHTH